MFPFEGPRTRRVHGPVSSAHNPHYRAAPSAGLMPSRRRRTSSANWDPRRGVRCYAFECVELALPRTPPAALARLLGSASLPDRRVESARRLAFPEWLRGFYT